MNHSLPQLPEYDPHPDLWVRIDADLARNADSSVESFGRLVHDLPTYEPKADIWATIEQELDKPTLRPIWSKPQTHWLWTGLTAAAAIVLVGIWLYLNPKTDEQIRVEYAVEQATQPNPDPAPSIEPTGQSPADKRAEEFINRQCDDYQALCQRPEVHELRNQLAELETEQQRIVHERQVFGDDPVFVRAQVKVENQRAEVLKELITLLRS
ncbi:hypothetical protein [Spirosoma validum]|uniref:Uncharacterized protein n=1 Tax=Spirosoma validum TaxID=2771355 RepID=A0A927B3N2_9BACT|nr:hypothetical protein [Spirosoma validum]MBD2754800.1 hypothetical protein [Spirosoma validum]